MDLFEKFIKNQTQDDEEEEILKYERKHDPAYKEWAVVWQKGSALLMLSNEDATPVKAIRGMANAVSFYIKGRFEGYVDLSLANFINAFLTFKVENKEIVEPKFMNVNEHILNDILELNKGKSASIPSIFAGIRELDNKLASADEVLKDEATRKLAIAAAGDVRQKYMPHAVQCDFLLQIKKKRVKVIAAFNKEKMPQIAKLMSMVPWFDIWHA